MGSKKERWFESWGAGKNSVISRYIAENYPTALSIKLVKICPSQVCSSAVSDKREGAIHGEINQEGSGETSIAFIPFEQPRGKLTVPHTI